MQIFNGSSSICHIHVCECVCALAKSNESTLWLNWSLGLAAHFPPSHHLPLNPLLISMFVGISLGRTSGAAARWQDHVSFLILNYFTLVCPLNEWAIPSLHCVCGCVSMLFLFQVLFFSAWLSTLCKWSTCRCTASACRPLIWLSTLSSPGTALPPAAGIFNLPHSKLVSKNASFCTWLLSWSGLVIEYTICRSSWLTMNLDYCFLRSGSKQ